uniref:Uncharacterized protein n=1 Tax=Timspurckia oligopyrenoides TaxID=708627 RepID=A0A7S0ZCC3_9RHOD|mmetsp:Transcript_12190/g.22043  ORF Transcript_12190/g.22043 Transcript_12190/m.22043 type:complete len:438 (+) Transcript_12190:70-1383(+)
MDWLWRLFSAGGSSDGLGSSVFIWGGIFGKSPRALNHPVLQNSQSISLGMDTLATISTSGNVHAFQYESLINEESDHDFVHAPILMNRCISVAVGPFDSVVSVTKDGSVYQFDAIPPIPTDVDASNQNPPPFLAEPRRLEGALKKIKAVSVNCSSSHCVAVGSKGEAVAWSDAVPDQLEAIAPALGRGPGSESLKANEARQPVAISGLDGISIQKAACGATHTALLDSERNLFFVGSDRWGQTTAWKSAPWNQGQQDPRKHRVLGPYKAPDGDIGIRYTAEKMCPDKNNYYTERSTETVACGSAHTIGSMLDHRIVSFGFNQWGSCGHHNYNHIAPVGEVEKLPAPTKVAGLAAGASHSLVALQDMTTTDNPNESQLTKIFSFGANERGQLGNGTLQASSVPQIILSVTGFRTLAAGMSTSAVIASSIEESPKTPAQ